MTIPVFERSSALLELGFDHGFGTRRSAQEAVSQLALARQVHGDRTIEALAPEAGRAADALFTRVPGLAVGVWTADCVPILLADSSRGGVAAIHAGWRGSALGIAGKAVEAFAKSLGVAPRALIAVIGPHIGACCYEVDAPVRAAIADDAVFRPGTRSGHDQLDLLALNRKQLLAAGLRASCVWSVPGCTACDAPRYWSFRRERGPGRMLHYIRMVDDKGRLERERGGSTPHCISSSS